jgi:hypothetical protein
MVITAIVQLGIAYHNYLRLAEAVRAGGRVAAVSRTAADPVAATRTSVKKAAGDLTLTDAQIAVQSTGSPAWQSGADVTVSATYPYTISIFGIPVRSGSFTSTTTQRVE